MLPVLFRKSDTATKNAFTRALDRFRKNRALARERLEEQAAREEALLMAALTPVAAKQDEVYVRARCAVTCMATLENPVTWGPIQRRRMEIVTRASKKGADNQAH